MTAISSISRATTIVLAMTIVQPALGQPVPECCPVTSPCAGDANQNGVVDPLDSGFIMARFGDDVLGADNCLADVNCDGVIDPLDLGYALDRFNTCEAVTQCAAGGGECDPNDCCPGDTIPGCQDTTIRDCVCAFDPFCCDQTWDEACEAEVTLFGCGVCIPGCDGIPVNDDCGCVTPVVIEDNEVIQFFGDTTGATLDCDPLGLPEVWHAWTHNQTDTIRIDFCGSTIDFDAVYIVTDNSCPCDGTFIFGTQFTAVCADASTTIGLRIPNLAPGTYYYPVLTGQAGIDGQYSVRIRRNNVN